MDTIIEEILTEKTWVIPEHLLNSLKSVAVFGTGQGGVILTRLLESKGINIAYYLDNDINKQGTIFLGKKVYLPEHTYNKKTVVLIGSYWAKSIAEQLHAEGVTYYDFSFCTDYDRWKNHFNPRFFNASSAVKIAKRFLKGNDLEAYLGCIRYRQTLDPLYLKPATFDHYLHPDVLPRSDDVFMDGGAWQGDTAEELKNYFGDDIKLYCFEPDKENREKLNELILRKGFQNVHVSHFGLWECQENLRFISSESADHTMQSRVNMVENDETVIEIEAIDLDTFCFTKQILVDYIKLDVEGAEPQVMKGAAKILCERAPRLAISAYHEPEQLWQLIVQIHDINPAYTFYFAHHSENLLESVIYAEAI